MGFAGSNPANRTTVNMDNSATIPFGATSDAARTDSTGSARRSFYAGSGATTNAVRPNWTNISTKSLQSKLGRRLDGLTNNQLGTNSRTGPSDYEMQRQAELWQDLDHINDVLCSRGSLPDELKPAIRLLRISRLTAVNDFHRQEEEGQQVIQNLQSQITDLQGQLDERAYKEKQRRERERLETAQLQVESRLREEEDEVRCQNEADATRLLLKKVDQTRRQELAEAERREQLVQRELESSCRHVEEGQQVIQNLQSQITGLQGQLDDRREEEDEAVKRVHREVADKDRQLVQAQLKITELRGRVQEEARHLSNARRDMADKTAQLAQAQFQITGHQERVQEEARHLSNARRVVTNKDKQLTQAQLHYTELKERFQEETRDRVIAENTLCGNVAEAVRGLEQVQQELADTHHELGEEQCLCHAMEEQANRKGIYFECLFAIIKLQALFCGTLQRRSTFNEVSMDYVPPSVPISPPRGVHLQPVLPPTPVAYNEGTTAKEVKIVTPYMLIKEDDDTTPKTLRTMDGVAYIEEIQAGEQLADLTSAVRELFPDESIGDDSTSRSVKDNSSDDEQEEKEEEEEPDEDNDTSGSRGDVNPDNDPDDPPDTGSGDGTSPSGGGNPDCTDDAIDPPADALGGDNQSQHSSWSASDEDRSRENILAKMAEYQKARKPATSLHARWIQCVALNTVHKVRKASVPTKLRTIDEYWANCQTLSQRDRARHQRRGFGGTLFSTRQTRGHGRQRSSKKRANNSHVAKKGTNNSDRFTLSDKFSDGKTSGDVSIKHPVPSKPTRWAQPPQTKKNPHRKSSRSKGHGGTNHRLWAQPPQSARHPQGRTTRKKPPRKSSRSKGHGGTNHRDHGGPHHKKGKIKSRHRSDKTCRHTKPKSTTRSTERIVELFISPFVDSFSWTAIEAGIIKNGIPPSGYTDVVRTQRDITLWNP